MQMSKWIAFKLQLIADAVLPAALVAPVAVDAAKMDPPWSASPPAKDVTTPTMTAKQVTPAAIDAAGLGTSGASGRPVGVVST